MVEFDLNTTFAVGGMWPEVMGFILINNNTLLQAVRSF